MVLIKKNSTWALINYSVIWVIYYSYIIEMSTQVHTIPKFKFTLVYLNWQKTTGFKFCSKSGSKHIMKSIGMTSHMTGKC